MWSNVFLAKKGGSPTTKMNILLDVFVGRGGVHINNNDDDVVNRDDNHNNNNNDADVDVFLTQQPALWLDAFLAKRGVGPWDTDQG